MTINESATVPFPSLVGVNGNARARDHSKWCMLYVDLVISLFCSEDLLVAPQWHIVKWFRLNAVRIHSNIDAVTGQSAKTDTNR